MAKQTPKLSAQIREEASAWFVDFQEGAVDQAGCEEFSAWLRRSPEHVRAFLQVSALWEDAGALGNRPDLNIDDLIARAQGAERNVHPLGFTGAITSRNGMDGARDRKRLLRTSLAAVAATLLLAVGVSLTVWYTLFRDPVYTTGIGEQRSITLEDGSSVELNSRSRVRVEFTPSERSVELIEGQALFNVAKDPARPFVVTAGDASVRAVGTRFDVYRKRTGTVVTVVEGRVAVTPARAPDGVRPGELLLAAGEQLTVSAAVIASPPTVANVAAATAWTDKKLVFDSTPLREVVEEFNRHNRRQLVIRDPDLYEFHVSGVFPSTDSGRMAEFLRQRFGVTLRRSEDEIEISRRDGP